MGIALDGALLLERGAHMDDLLHWLEVVEDMAAEQAELDQWEDEE